MNIFLGLDLGTTYFKCVVVSESGESLGLSRVAVETRHPQPGYCEIPFPDFTRIVKKAVENALEISGCSPGDVVSLSYSSQANSFALFDGGVSPISPVVLWTDERDADGSVFNSESYAFFRERGIGSRTLPVKLLWFQHNVSAIWAKTQHILTVSDILVYLLTGELCADAATTSLTGMLRQDYTAYDTECTEALKLTHSMLPSIVLPGTEIGPTTGTLAAALGLRPTTTLIAGNLDHVSAAIGAGIGSLSPVSISIGTVLAVTDIVDAAHEEELHGGSGCITGPYLHADSRFRLAFRDLGASTLEWYRNTFASGKTFSQLTEEAGRVSLGCDGLVVLPHSAHNLGRSKSIFASTRSATLANDDGYYVRAIMEFTAATLGDLFDTVFVRSAPKQVVATGGGSLSSLWLQIVADVTGVVVVRSDVVEPAAYGAAMLAARGARRDVRIERFSHADSHKVCTYTPDSTSNRAYKDWKERSYEPTKPIV